MFDCLEQKNFAWVQNEKYALQMKIMCFISHFFSLNFFTQDRWLFPSKTNPFIGNGILFCIVAHITHILWSLIVIVSIHHTQIRSSCLKLYHCTWGQSSMPFVQCPNALAINIDQICVEAITYVIFNTFSNRLRPLKIRYEQYRRCRQ